jgi:outer membrane protein TolC
VERAVSANLDLCLAEACNRQAGTTRIRVTAGRWPTIDTSGTYQRNYAGGSSGSGTVDLFRAGLDASWELDFFGGVRRSVEAAEADLQADVEDRRDVLVSLVAELGVNYIGIQGFKQQIGIANKNLQAQQHTVEITRKRHDAGFASGLDVANANAQVVTTQSQILVLESSAQAAIYSGGVCQGTGAHKVPQALRKIMP